jgi:hypothetical protein
MSNGLRLAIAVVVIFSIASAALAPAPRRAPGSTWRWGLRWLMPAALAWAGVAHYLHAPTVSRLLLVGFVEVACLEVWFLRAKRDPAGGDRLRRWASRRRDSKPATDADGG